MFNIPTWLKLKTKKGRDIFKYQANEIQDTGNITYLNGYTINNSRTINKLEVYAQDQESDGHPFPPGTQSSQYLRPHLTAHFTHIFVTCLQLLLPCNVMLVNYYTVFSL